MRRSSTRGGRRAAALALLLLLATGCQARLAVDIAVDRDGRGTIGVALGADEALQAEAEAAGADPLGDLAAAGAALGGQGWRTSDTTGEDGSRTVALTGDFASPEEFGEIAGALAEALAGPELVPLRDLALAVEDDVIRLSGLAGLVPQPAVTDLGVQPEQAVALLADADGLVYEVAVQLPGEVLATTAAAGGGQEPLRWVIAPGQEVELLAVSDRPVRRWWLLAAAGAAGGLALLGLLAGLRGRARRRRAVSA